MTRATPELEPLLYSCYTPQRQGRTLALDRFSIALAESALGWRCETTPTMVRYCHTGTYHRVHPLKIHSERWLSRRNFDFKHTTLIRDYMKFKGNT
ncbi:hypothetical protein TNCV_1930401 [Trichonephila clavipes]|nr:hypothetical protein TNCV_1930401 [Trichonephila clavipes]